MLSLWIIPPTYAVSHPVQLGEETVIIQEEYQKPGPVYVHLHQNEHTALQAARTVAQKKGGRVITLKHRGGRNIIFHLKGKRYEFDPNRIFTSQGIKNTLASYSTYTLEAHQAVNRLATTIKKLLPKRQRVIAVHNNQSYSLKNYYRGRSLSAEAKALYQNPKRSFRNFFVVTQKKDYERFKQLKHNSILQKENPRDDGSLSVYLSDREYINVEAGYHQFNEQVLMLKIA